MTNWSKYYCQIDKQVYSINDVVPLTYRLKFGTVMCLTRQNGFGKDTQDYHSAASRNVTYVHVAWHNTLRLGCKSLAQLIKFAKSSVWLNRVLTRNFISKVNLLPLWRLENLFANRLWSMSNIYSRLSLSRTRLS